VAIQRLLVPLFTFVWWRRLTYPDPAWEGATLQAQVIKVKGWRTAIVRGTAFHGRSTVTFCFWWFK